MTYNDIEIELGRAVREPDTSSSNWSRYSQTFRRRAIRAAEMRMAEDLPEQLVPKLITNAPITVDSSFEFDADSLEAPMLRPMFFMNNGRKVLIRGLEEVARERTMWRASSVRAYRKDSNKFAFIVKDGTAYGSFTPTFYYVKSPQTKNIFHPAILHGGAGAATSVATYAAVSDGEFRISIDGDQQDLSGIDMSSAETMDDVATAIQTVVRAVGSGGYTNADVIWDENNGKWIIVSGATSGASSITAISDHAGGGTYIGDSTYMDCEATDGIEIINGEQGFAFGDRLTEFTGYENMIMMYATHWLKLNTQKFDEAKIFRDLYISEVNQTLTAHGIL